MAEKKEVKKVKKYICVGPTTLRGVVVRKGDIVSISGSSLVGHSSWKPVEDPLG